jgi:phosphatidylserine/phosphatidylglycerophosphate/cardiolipin synthase-like enzyme
MLSMKSPLLCVLLLMAMLPQSFAQSRAKILDDNLEALKARLELIQNAEKEILFTTYIFSEDEISKYFLAELQLAVERGVSVKLIIDASNNYFKPKFLKYINRLGIETKLYNRFKGYNVGDFVKFRLHAKVLLVDYNQLIIGGRNIGGEYFGLKESNYQDRDIYIEGPSVTHLRSFFFNYFNSKNSEFVIQRRFWNCFNNKKLCERKELVVLEKLFAAKLSIDSSLLARRLEDCNWKRDLLLIDTLNFYFDNSTLKRVDSSNKCNTC